MLKYLLAKMYAIGLALFFGGIFFFINTPFNGTNTNELRLFFSITIFFQHNTDIHTYMLYTCKFVLKKIIE